MNLEADVSVLTTQQRSLLEALPCYVFVQRGEKCGLRQSRGARNPAFGGRSVLPVDDLFSGQFPGAVYAIRKRRIVAKCFRLRWPGLSPLNQLQYGRRWMQSVPVRGNLPVVARGTEAGAADRCAAITSECENDARQDQENGAAFVSGQDSPSNFLEHLSNAG